MKRLGHNVLFRFSLSSIAAPCARKEKVKEEHYIPSFSLSFGILSHFFLSIFSFILPAELDLILVPAVNGFLSSFRSLSFHLPFSTFRFCQAINLWNQHEVCR